MARAARSMARAAVSTMFLWPAQAIQKGLTCCAGVSSTVASHETDNTPIQPSTTSMSAAATTHIFSSNKTTPKQPHKSCQPSPSAKARLNKLSGLWSWVTDPTGFDHASDKLKAQRRAAKLSRARAHLSIAGSEPDSPRIIAAYPDRLFGLVDTSMVHLQCWVQQGVQDTAAGIVMQSSEVLADVHSCLREIDKWLTAQLELARNPQAYASATEDFVSPWEGYHEPLYDDHEVLKRWTPGPDITMSVDCLEALGPVMEFAHVAAQKLADRALQSAIDGAVADVIQAADNITLLNPVQQ